MQPNLNISHFLLLFDSPIFCSPRRWSFLIDPKRWTCIAYLVLRTYLDRYSSSFFFTPTAAAADYDDLRKILRLNNKTNVSSTLPSKFQTKEKLKINHDQESLEKICAWMRGQRTQFGELSDKREKEGKKRLRARACRFVLFARLMKKYISICVLLLLQQHTNNSSNNNNTLFNCNLKC